jgi:hypothetical protein
MLIVAHSKYKQSNFGPDAFPEDLAGKFLAILPAYILPATQLNWDV